MRRLADHHHVVKLHASYVVGRELALILTPVADDGDLADFLHAYRDLSLSGTQPKSDRLVDSLASMQRTLENAYGCLAAGLAFMHEQTIRHKDIKPQNILVHRGSVLYTDFGISIDFSTLGHSTTTGRADSFTRRYWPLRLLSIKNETQSPTSSPWGVCFLRSQRQCIRKISQNHL